MAPSGDGHEWLLITVSTGKVAALRVFVWRQLRQLGAIYLHQSVCLLPDRPPVAKTIARLVARVRDQGGQARVVKIRVTDPAEQAALVAEQRDHRDAEYAEVVERAPQLLAEIETETSRGRATYVEVEESEADLERFDRWLAKIAARDYFAAEGGAAARTVVEQCRDALAAFEATALAADTTSTDADDSPRQTAQSASARAGRLHVVDND